MIDANTIKSLLKGVDVEWKKITDIFNIKNGYTPSKTNTEFWTDGDIPWFRMEDIRENGRILNNSLQKINKVAIKGGKLFPANSIIISTSATIGEHALITIPYLSNQRFTNFSLKNEFKKILNIKFVYYYFFIFSENAKKIVNISSLPSVQMTELKKWNFPILSLDVQNKIVNILDTFTALTTELTIELNARLNQYNYYRDKLLSFAEDEIEHKKLGDILVRTKGTKITANEMKKIHKDKAEVKIFAGGKTFAFVDYEDIPLKNINKEPSIIVKSRGIIEFEFYDKPFSHKNEMWSYHSKNKNINIKYIYYYLKNKEKFFQQIGSKMQMPQISIPDTDGFVIPIPPLSKQKQIVEILDKFDALTNSITEGLPREIELRQKQYEYYRNLLLDFPKS
ncbi:restriction endonuclease subunit S [Gilliamella apicola]|uniref:restriction endonuclease subunit S n=6 Tax=Gilliamella apicola TaxID=1196095 RepID=UPI0009FD2278|nr:restriction endonuclease subunit S [Gilliamella apicola]ORF45731.1 restriction endonuclease subunit S [Gilliamella apicola]ORF49154.1 restriction endonuclease subunit S [Gilliamella apicola]ORF54605.1 restriction endonuclease subunit S [Gilliamella apicola]ORF59529.1 restriction endonuclease subunit S [Gilliamella apicola]